MTHKALTVAILVIGILVGGIAVVIGSEYLVSPSQPVPIMEERYPLPTYDDVRECVREYLKSEEGKSLIASAVQEATRAQLASILASGEFKAALSNLLSADQIRSLFQSALPGILSSQAFQTELKSQLESALKQAQPNKR
ncbi:MAG: hypothetical protein ACPLPR_01830 [Bacillota bacterium]